MHDNNPATGNRDIDGPGNTAFAFHADLPGLIDEVLDMGSANLLGTKRH